MAEYKMPKGSDAFNMMSDVFRFVSQYGEPEESDEYWRKVFDGHNAICDKYEKDPKLFHLTVSIMTGVMNHLEIMNERKKGK